jgi:hypothetical protein
MVLFSFLTFLFTTLHSGSEEGQTLSAANLHIENSTFVADTLPELSYRNIMTSAGQLKPYKETIFNNVVFRLVVNGNDTLYLSTNEKTFQTPEGYKVGMKLSELPASIQKNLTKERGWGFYYTLPSGWALGFCEGSSCTTTYPTSTSLVKWIFRRKE